ncbi:hypothetical protein KCP75_08995 [Salmonella enterica subsp. enterica]|nr:hypothetical protein KCP75_08995 [Salmonella enterica subsp. enterica]
MLDALELPGYAALTLSPWLSRREYSPQDSARVYGMASAGGATLYTLADWEKRGAGLSR